MLKQQEERYLQVIEIIEKGLIQTFWDHLEKHEKLLNEVKHELVNIRSHEPKDEENLAVFTNYKQNLLTLTKKLKNECLKTQGQELQRFESLVEQFLKELPEKITEPQLPERFYAQDGDNRLRRVAKFVKRIGFHISKWPEQVANTWRKVSGRTPILLRPWYHHIYLQNLGRFYLKEKLREQLTPVFERYFETVISTTLSLWSQDEQIDKLMNVMLTNSEPDSPPVLETQEDKEKQLIEVAKQEIKQQITDTLGLLWNQFVENYDKAGTIEFANKKISSSRIISLRNKTEKRLEPLIKNWNNAILAVQDDWEIDLELYQLIYSILNRYKHTHKKVAATINDNIFDVLAEIADFIDKLKSTIENTKTDKALKSLLADQMPSIKNDLDKLVEKNSENILNQNLSQTIDQIGSYINEEIGKLSTRRAVIKGGDYVKPKKSTQFNYISPYELINFECAPGLVKVLAEVKRNTITNLNEAENILLQLIEIATFNLESAISAIDENDDQQGKTIALTGLDRITDQLANIRTALLKIDSDLEATLFTGIQHFNHNAIKLTNNENLLELRMRIAKGKAAERSKELQKQVVTTFKNLAPILIRKLRMYVSSSYLFLKGNLQKIGIGVERATITTELADFLAQTEEAVNSLPFVYQRLFRTLPLEDEAFFEGRQKEMKMLSGAQELWRQERFAASIVIGERGAGLSSLFNLYLKRADLKSKVIIVAPTHNLHTEEQLIEIFSNSLDLKIENLDQLIHKLKNGAKRTIVVENLQRFFLKKVNGFNNIKILTELISETSKRVFWLIGCTSYGYSYLDKTLQVSEHFSYIIYLENLSSANIIDLIDRRHKVSGYNLEFEPSVKEKSSKKFNNMPHVEKMNHLKAEFFEELNKIARSNIGIALIYWLRSTQHTIENTISIKSLKDIDFSFMKSLSNNKLYVLHMLLLHDGLSEADISMVNGLSISQCKRILYPLFEDGIIIKRDDIFLINPLLYRQTVNLLKTKNILH